MVSVSLQILKICLNFHVSMGRQTYSYILYHKLLLNQIESAVFFQIHSPKNPVNIEFTGKTPIHLANWGIMGYNQNTVVVSEKGGKLWKSLM